MSAACILLLRLDSRYCGRAGGWPRRLVLPAAGARLVRSHPLSARVRSCLNCLLVLPGAVYYLWSIIVALGEGWFPLRLPHRCGKAGATFRGHLPVWTVLGEMACEGRQSWGEWLALKPFSERVSDLNSQVSGQLCTRGQDKWCRTPYLVLKKVLHIPALVAHSLKSVKEPFSHTTQEL